MKVEKFKVLLYLKKSGLDKSGKAPIMGRITVNRTTAQFSSKLSCTPQLWNPRESRLNGKSKEAVEINAKIDKLLLAINSAFDSLLERKNDFDATAVKEAFQGRFSNINAYSRLHILNMNIQSLKQRHLSFNATLKRFFDCCCIEINLAFQERIKCRVYGKQQLVNLGIDFNSLLAFAI